MACTAKITGSQEDTAGLGSRWTSIHHCSLDLAFFLQLKQGGTSSLMCAFIQSELPLWRLCLSEAFTMVDASPRKSLITVQFEESLSHFLSGSVSKSQACVKSASECLGKSSIIQAVYSGVITQVCLMFHDGVTASCVIHYEQDPLSLCPKIFMYTYTFLKLNLYVR